MKIGTKSLLFGVHQFLWHPFTVVLAWRKLYGCWPNWREFIAIVFHDVGYWGLPNMDGPEGRRHPYAGAALAGKLVFRINRLKLWLKNPWLEEGGAIHYSLIEACATYRFAVGHSRELAKQEGRTASPLCWADKLCIVFEPSWFYLFRARLSGELQEFKERAVPAIGHVSDREWLSWYRARVWELIEKLPDNYCAMVRRGSKGLP